MKCSSCRTHVLAKSNFVQFQCPSCGNEKLVRCQTCKAMSTKYICKACGFVGP